jgi:Fe/S biogenesis protein NfuA
MSKMITITETAREGLLQLMDQKGPFIGLRLVVTGEVPGAYMPELMFMRDSHASKSDKVVEFDGLNVYIGPESVDKAEGLKVDIVHTQAGPRLKFEFPPVEWDDPVAQRLQKLIDQHINPGLMSHGGFVALLDVQDGVAEIFMGGGCQGCALSAMTLSQSIEAIIKREIPEIHTVVDCTDHARGNNPYYASDHSGKRTPPERDEELSKSARRRTRRKRE